MLPRRFSTSASDFLADLVGFAIPSVTGERMYACLFKPEGDGPRPTVLLLHGYPGDENNYDLAHAFQREGYTVVVFHYRGTWGSEGLFSLCHVLEDVASVIEFIRRHSGEETYRFDAERLILIGHSMGGFAALQTAARDSGIGSVGAVAAFDFSLAAEHPNLRDAARKEFAECLPVRRIGLDDLMREIDENAAAWSFPSLADRLSEKAVCLVGGAKDVISPPKRHLIPLAGSLKQAGAPGLTVSLIDDGHCLSGSRPELSCLLLQWAGGPFHSALRENEKGKLILVNRDKTLLIEGK